MIDDIISGEAPIARGTDFGRQFLSVRPHGNVIFKLKDKAVIPLNSYIIAQNSSVLKNQIEEEGKLDHDLSNYDPESVRIFIDGCYSGTLSKLTDSTTIEVFRDLMLIVNKFNVEWAKDWCLDYFKRHLPKSLDNFSSYWEFALLALGASVTFENHTFMSHLISNVPDKKEVLLFHCFRLLDDPVVQHSKRKLELMLALVVEFKLLPGFMLNLHKILIQGKRNSLIDHILDNFNFGLCDDQCISNLSSAMVHRNMSRFAKSFIRAIRREKSAADDDSSDVAKGKIQPLDGRLATLARNYWVLIGNSSWPCSRQRPFTLVKRQLVGEVDQVGKVVEVIDLLEIKDEEDEDMGSEGEESKEEEYDDQDSGEDRSGKEELEKDNGYGDHTQEKEDGEDVEEMGSEENYCTPDMGKTDTITEDVMEVVKPEEEEKKSSSPKRRKTRSMSRLNL
eukprot:sb/3464652/